MPLARPITPGIFGPGGLGSADGRPGRFTARGYEIPTASGLMPGRFGPNGYGADTSMWQRPAACEAGIWAPSAALVSVGPWTRQADCSAGAWDTVDFSSTRVKERN